MSGSIVHGAGVVHSQSNITQSAGLQDGILCAVTQPWLEDIGLEEITCIHNMSQPNVLAQSAL